MRPHLPSMHAATLAEHTYVQPAEHARSQVQGSTGLLIQTHVRMRGEPRHDRSHCGPAPAVFGRITRRSVRACQPTRRKRGGRNGLRPWASHRQRPAPIAEARHQASCAPATSMQCRPISPGRAWPRLAAPGRAWPCLAAPRCAGRAAAGRARHAHPAVHGHAAAGHAGLAKLIRAESLSCVLHSSACLAR